MSHLVRRRPSAALIVAIAALVTAASGTAVAASQFVSGDKLIRKDSLSGNRLRAHTITGSQVNLGKLGKVPSAGIADNASELGGLPSSSYLRSGAVISSGLVTSVLWAGGEDPQEAVTVLKNGPLSLTGTCVWQGLKYTSTLYANSTMANWLSSGKVQNSFSTVIATDTTNGGAESGTTVSYDLESPDGTSLRGQATIAENWPADAKCGFTAYSVG